jgi:hypothetical protein
MSLQLQQPQKNYVVNVMDVEDSFGVANGWGLATVMSRRM